MYTTRRSGFDRDDARLHYAQSQRLKPKVQHVPLFGVYVVDTDDHMYVMDDFGSLVSVTNETFAFTSTTYYRFS